MKRFYPVLYWTLPSLFCLAVWWLGLFVWFQRDDFAWLGLYREVHSRADLGRVLFEPKAQGTIRPLSERAFFLGFWSLFGANAFPYRLLVFLTQFSNLVLLTAVARRVTGSAAAGFWAAVFWSASWVLAAAMCWTSAYNQVLCAFFLLLSFYLLLRHIETGQWRYYAAQCVTFLLGFGALEINVVYPAIAAGYALVCARRFLPRLVPLFLVSIAYAIVHTLAAPPPRSGVYAVQFDWHMAATVFTYWQWAMRPDRARLALPLGGWFWRFATIALTTGLAAFVLTRLRRSDGRPVFFLAWFAITLAPVVPLRNHVSDYYLTIPMAGLAALGAWAVTAAWQGSREGRVVALALGALYLGMGIAAARNTAAWNYEQSNHARRAITNAIQGREPVPGLTSGPHTQHPRNGSKAGAHLLLAGVDDDLYKAALRDDAFRTLGIAGVYLAPPVAPSLWPSRLSADAATKTLPAAVVKTALEREQLTILDVTGSRAMDVTPYFKKLAGTVWPDEQPRWVAIGDPLFTGQLGAGWYNAESGFRWMGRRAGVRMAGPAAAADRLAVLGYCPARQVREGPLELRVSAGAETRGPCLITDADSQFECVFQLPPGVLGRPNLEYVLELSRTFTAPPDTRDLGVPVTRVEIR